MIRIRFWYPLRKQNKYESYEQKCMFMYLGMLIDGVYFFANLVDWKWGHVTVSQCFTIRHERTTQYSSSSGVGGPGGRWRDVARAQVLLVPRSLENQLPEVGRIVLHLRMHGKRVPTP